MTTISTILFTILLLGGVPFVLTVLITVPSEYWDKIFTGALFTVIFIVITLMAIDSLGLVMSKLF